MYVLCYFMPAMCALRFVFRSQLLHLIKKAYSDSLIVFFFRFVSAFSRFGFGPPFVPGRRGDFFQCVSIISTYFH